MTITEPAFQLSAAAASKYGPYTHSLATLPSWNSVMGSLTTVDPVAASDDPTFPRRNPYHNLIMDRRMKRQQLSELNGPDSAYLSVLSSHTLVRGKEVTQQEYNSFDTAAIYPNRNELDRLGIKIDEHDEEGLKDAQRVWHIMGNVLSDQAWLSAVQPIVAVQQPFKDFNTDDTVRSSDGTLTPAPTIFEAFQRYIGGEIGALERMGVPVENGSIIVQLNTGSKTCPDPTYFPPDELIPLPMSNPVFSSIGLDPLKWQISQTTLNDRPITHLHYLKWPDGGQPPAEDTQQLASVFRQLSNPSSELYALAGVNRGSTEKGEGSLDMSGLPAIIVHCLAGKGRTGVFNAALTSTQHAIHLASHFANRTPFSQMVNNEARDRAGKILDDQSLRFLVSKGMVVEADGSSYRGRQKPVFGSADTELATRSAATEKGIGSDRLPEINLSSLHGPYIITVPIVDAMNDVRPAVEHAGPLEWLTKYVQNEVLVPLGTLLLDQGYAVDERYIDEGSRKKGDELYGRVWKGSRVEASTWSTGLRADHGVEVRWWDDE